MYSSQLLDHFQNPRNAGDLSDADATVEIENPVCGDVIRLSVKFDADRIAEIRFKAKGCVPSMACGSALRSRRPGEVRLQVGADGNRDGQNCRGSRPARQRRSSTRRWRTAPGIEPCRTVGTRCAHSRARTNRAWVTTYSDLCSSLRSPRLFSAISAVKT